MVIGLLILASIPTVTGVAQAISAQKTKEQRETDEKRMQKFYIDVSCEAQSARAGELHAHRLVLKNDRVWIGNKDITNPCKDGYVAEAFYIEYPDNERVPVPLGLASQVAVNPPLLNWIYVDKDTMEVRYGNKTASVAHNVGPWDWTEDQERVVFEENAVFTAVEDAATKRWQVYLDMEGDELSRVVPRSRRRLLINLQRHELSAPAEVE